MNYTKAAGEKSTVKLTITFTEEEWKEAIGKAYLKTRGKYAVPGFRKGKAPQPMLEKYYGKGVFFEEAFNYLYNQHYFAILDKEKSGFTAVGEPELNVESMEEGKGVVLSAIVPVKPDIKIEKYTGLKIKKFEYNVTDEEVMREANKIAASNATTVEVTDRAAKLGDIVNIDFSGSVDGEKFAGGTAEEYDLELGSNSFIPGFEDALVGMKTGENRNIDVTFPEDYSADNLRGKDAVFAVKLNKITERQYPELTDEFVKSKTGVETVEQYKKNVRERLERTAENRGRDETEGSILAEISKYTTAEIPDAMIESEIDRIVQDFSYRLMYQGLKLDEYLKYVGQTIEQFRSQYVTEARRRVLCQLIVDKIVKTEKFKVEDGELDKKIEEQAKSVDKTLAEYKKSMDPRQIEYISNDIIVTKLFDFLQANNEMVSDTPAEKPAKKPAAKKPAAAKAEGAEEAPAAKKPAAKKPAAKKTAPKAE